MTTFIDYARTVLERRAEDGIRGIVSAGRPSPNIEVDARYDCNGLGGSPIFLASKARQRLARIRPMTHHSGRRCVMRAIDLTGRVVGDLTVLRFLGSEKDCGGHARRLWLVRCVCGVEKSMPAGTVTGGKVVSCGCSRRADWIQERTVHGMRSSAEYRAWGAMKDRCHRAGNIGYANYGGRGIRVCPEWRKSFAAFFEHIGPKPTQGHSVDRIDNNGHYEPGNVRWATKAEQMANRGHGPVKP